MNHAPYSRIILNQDICAALPSTYGNAFPMLIPPIWKQRPSFTPGACASTSPLFTSSSLHLGPPRACTAIQAHQNERPGATQRPLLLLIRVGIQPRTPFPAAAARRMMRAVRTTGRAVSRGPIGSAPPMRTEKGRPFALLREPPPLLLTLRGPLAHGPDCPTSTDDHSVPRTLLPPRQHNRSNPGFWQRCYKTVRSAAVLRRVTIQTPSI